VKSFVVLFGLLLTGKAFAAAPCSQPSTPDFPAATPINERADKRLSRETVRYISHTAKYIACLRADTSLDPAMAAQQENQALHAVMSLIDLYETSLGHSEQLVAAIKQLVSPAQRANIDRRIAAAERVLESEAVPTLNAAIAHINARRFGEARAAIGELDFERLNAFERSKAEQILYTIAYYEEDFVVARQHLEKSIVAGGLTADERFRARLALTNVDVMLRLRDSAFERVTEQRGE
jgi:hypothetical protein